MMFSLFRSKRPGPEVEARKAAWRAKHDRVVAAMRPVVEAATAYNAELPKRRPKDFWIEAEEVRVLLGRRNHVNKFGFHEETLWINFDADAGAYRMSIFTGESGGEKVKEEFLLSAADEAIALMRRRCEDYFTIHDGAGSKTEKAK